MISLFKNALVLLAIVLTGGIGYYLYTHNNSEVASSNNAAVDNSIAADTEGFLRDLNELKVIELDGSLLSDPRFGSLVSYSSQVQAQPIGSPDPFDVTN